jgi:hypothetical protein
MSGRMSRPDIQVEAVLIPSNKPNERKPARRKLRTGSSEFRRVAYARPRSYWLRRRPTQFADGTPRKAALFGVGPK